MAEHLVIDVDFRSGRVTRRRQVLSEAEVPAIELPPDWRDHLCHSLACRSALGIFSDRECLCSYDHLIQQLSRLEALARS